MLRDLPSQHSPVPRISHSSDFSRAFPASARGTLPAGVCNSCLRALWNVQASLRAVLPPFPSWSMAEAIGSQSQTGNQGRGKGKTGPEWHSQSLPETDFITCYFPSSELFSLAGDWCSKLYFHFEQVLIWGRFLYHNEPGGASHKVNLAINPWALLPGWPWACQSRFSSRILGRAGPWWHIHSAVISLCPWPWRTQNCSHTAVHEFCFLY